MAQWVDMEAEKITYWTHVGHERDAWFLFSISSMSTHWSIRWFIVRICFWHRDVCYSLSLPLSRKKKPENYCLIKKWPKMAHFHYVYRRWTCHQAILQRKRWQPLRRRPYIFSNRLPRHVRKAVKFQISFSDFFSSFQQRYNCWKWQHK